jgi:hypothetical protein
VPTPDEIARAIYLKPLGAAGDALYETAWAKFTAGN